METQSTDDVELSSNLPTEHPEDKPSSVSEAALQDGERNHDPPPTWKIFPELRSDAPFSPSSLSVETLRQLILRDLEDEGWSHDSDDTPTNEASGEALPGASEEHEPGRRDSEQSGFQVVRKGRKKKKKSFSGENQNQESLHGFV